MAILGNLNRDGLISLNFNFKVERYIATLYFGYLEKPKAVSWLSCKKSFEFELSIVGAFA